jgi:hypothetical protein
MPGKIEAETKPYGFSHGIGDRGIAFLKGGGFE